MTVMGGLTVLEAFLLAIWITLNVVVRWNWYYYYTERVGKVCRLGTSVVNQQPGRLCILVVRPCPLGNLSQLCQATLVLGE